MALINSEVLTEVSVVIDQGTVCQPIPTDLGGVAQ